MRSASLLALLVLAGCADAPEDEESSFARIRVVPRDGGEVSLTDAQLDVEWFLFSTPDGLNQSGTQLLPDNPTTITLPADFTIDITGTDICGNGIGLTLRLIEDGTAVMCSGAGGQQSFTGCGSRDIDDPNDGPNVLTTFNVPVASFPDARCSRSQ